MKNILIIGATSAIAEATARLWTKEGHHFYLIARNADRLQTLGEDLKVRGAKTVHTAQLDLNGLEYHQAAIEQVIRAFGSIDTVLIAHGTLGNQEVCERDFASVMREVNTNLISVMSLLTLLANYFEKQKYGTIAVISSVAGDRGRESNYVYGTAKGAVTIFLQGLRQRLFKSGVHVLTIKPGFVDTPMTKEFEKGFLWVNPDKIARDICNAVKLNRNIIYTPWFWKPIMFIIKAIPDAIFNKLKL